MTRLLLLAAVALLPACAAFQKKPAPAPAPVAPTPTPKPDPAAAFAKASGAPRITIDLSEQRARFYKGGTLVTSTGCATGKAGHRTPAGSFSISQKVVDYRSRTWGKNLNADGSVARADADSRVHSAPEGGKFVGASMPYFMRFNGGVGMHAGRVPGYAASHGCVRLPRTMARLFYENAPVGTPVAVVP